MDIKKKKVRERERHREREKNITQKDGSEQQSMETEKRK